MGQGQSTTNGASPASEPTPSKSDYYELLDVERTATDDEIKKAYRRKALELHPDRNYGNVDRATQLFAEIQSAYEVLSDPQERAWYDSHRDVLLRGEQPGAAGAGEEFSYNIRMTTSEDVLKLMLKFNGRLAYTDSPSGFFGGLQDFFRKLAKEEDIACQWEDQDALDYPEFGTKDDDYDDVVRPFYAAWTGFATRKSYSWKDQYRLADAPDRRIRRLMEKENKKSRDEAIQEYNDAVRSLVAFVRKRDTRVQNNQKNEAERQKALREAAAAQAVRSRKERQAELEGNDTNAVPEWAKSRHVDENEGTFSSESDAEDHVYDCVVCDKTFKSEAQFQAHERSKKHIKLLKQLKKEMQKEGKEFDLEPKAEQGNLGIWGDGDDDIISRIESMDDENLEELSGDDENLSTPAAMNGTQKPKAEVMSPTENLKPAINSQPPSDSEDDDYAPRSEVESRLADTTSNTANNDLDSKISSINLDSPSDLDSGVATPSQQTGPKLGKAKLKRAKKAAVASSSSGGDRSASPSIVSGAFKCAVCQTDFTSKTKLFNHIKEKNHAAPISQMKSAAGTSKGGKGKKGKG